MVPNTLISATCCWDGEMLACMGAEGKTEKKGVTEEATAGQLGQTGRQMDGERPSGQEMEDGV